MPEQIRTDQIAGYSPGGRVETKNISLSGAGQASATNPKSTAAFSFVVGTVLIEITADSDNATDVYAAMWVNMRSYTGGKTANVTDRIGRGVSGSAIVRCYVDRTSSGTVITVSHVDEGTDFKADGTSIVSALPRNWPNPGRLRITAWEDTQS
jgi:hypothetical protein